jgi:AAA domain
VNAQEYVERREGRGARTNRTQDGWMVTCPAHDDRTPSLHVSEDADGNIGLHCFAECSTDAVLAADGLDWGDLFSNGGESNGRVEVDAYQYTDERGELLFEVVRFYPKDFRQRRPNGRGGWIWKLGDTRRVLYRLPKVIEAVQAGVTVYVAEGERDVHALERAGHVATCNPMGAGKWRDEYAESLRGANVVVVADCDQPGRDHAKTVGRALEGVAASVVIVEPVVGKDASEHLSADRAVDEFVPMSAGTAESPDDHGTVERLRVLDVEKMLTTTPPPVPWVVEPILAHGCVTMLAGREGRGKSMLALALAAAVGRATELLDVAGMPVALSGHVLYVDAENGEREAHRRVYGLSVEAGALTYVEANGFDLKQHLDDLDQLVREREPKVLVLDSLRSLAPGLDENDSLQVEQALRPIVRLTQQLHISTLLLHHASRASGEYRGSTAIGAAVELGFTLSRIDDDPMASTRRKLACWKSRPAAEPEPRWLTIKPELSGDIMLCEAAPYEPPRRAPVQDEIEGALRDLIGGVVGVVGDHTPQTRMDTGDSGGCGESGGHRGYHTTTPPSWSTADFARAVDRDSKDWSVRQAVKRLEDAGLIHRNGDDRWQRTSLDEKED